MWTVERCGGFDFLGAEYRELYGRSSATLFQHPVWLHNLYTSLAPQLRAEPVVVTVRADGDGRLVAVLPLVRRRGPVRRVEFADFGVTDYATPVIDRAAVPALSDSPVVSGAVRDAIGRVDLMRFDKVPGDVVEIASRFGAGRVIRHAYDAHAIPLDGSFQAWREARDPAFIRHIDRKRERVGRRRRVLTLRKLSDPCEIDAAFEKLREFRRARFAERRAVDLVQDPRYFDFYREVAHQGGYAGGPGSTVVLAINDETVGVSFGMSDAERDLFVLIGYDYERYRNYSLGLILVEELIAVSIDRGKRFHDLTIGHAGYKAAFGAVATPMYSVRLPLTARGWIAQCAADQNLAARRIAKSVLAQGDQLRGGRLSDRRASA